MATSEGAVDITLVICSPGSKQIGDIYEGNNTHIRLYCGEHVLPPTRRRVGVFRTAASCKQFRQYNNIAATVMSV